MPSKILHTILLVMLAAPVSGCGAREKAPATRTDRGSRANESRAEDETPAEDEATTPISSEVVRSLVAAGIEQTSYTKAYDPSYTKLAYPGGDVPRERGVCSDVVVRAFRACGVDLQKEVHEDMAANFSAYPRKWGLRAPDANIDHRRVPNLMAFFTRRGRSLPIGSDPGSYRPGDIVAWDLGNGLLHIGMVTNIQGADRARHKVVHNIGAGARVEDVLFNWRIIGHYRYFR